MNALDIAQSEIDAREERAATLRRELEKIEIELGALRVLAGRLAADSPQAAPAVSSDEARRMTDWGSILQRLSLIGRPFNYGDVLRTADELGFTVSSDAARSKMAALAKDGSVTRLKSGLFRASRPAEVNGADVEYGYEKASPVETEEASFI